MQVHPPLLTCDHVSWAEPHRGEGTTARLRDHQEMWWELILSQACPSKGIVRERLPTGRGKAQTGRETASHLRLLVPYFGPPQS